MDRTLIDGPVKILGKESSNPRLPDADFNVDIYSEPAGLLFLPVNNWHSFESIVIPWADLIKCDYDVGSNANLGHMLIYGALAPIAILTTPGMYTYVWVQYSDHDFDLYCARALTTVFRSLKERSL